MYLKRAKIIKHEIELEFECQTTKERISQKIKNPYINQGSYYEDWQYTSITFKCEKCNQNHTFEI